MDPGLRSPLIDFFWRGEVARDIRVLAASGGLAPRAAEQLALLMILADDPDPEVAHLASRTLDAVPVEPLAGFLAGPSATAEMRAFFEARGIQPSGTPPSGDEPLLTTDSGDTDDGAESDTRQPSLLTVPERIKVAMRGSREQRAVLIRDPNKMVAMAVLSSPKLTDSEIEAFARMANVSEDVLRVIGRNRAWTKNYAVVAALSRNPKTPPAISLQLVNRLTSRDVKILGTDRNVPEPVRLAARKLMTKLRLQ